MRIRGRRECRACGTRWSYYETGSVECPDCGSVHSVGLDDERRLHTDAAVELDLSAARTATDDSIRRVAELAGEEAREYVRRRGFVAGGELRQLDDRFLAAAELRHVADGVTRRMRVDEPVEAHLVALLAADTGERPAPEAVPQSLHAARGLAVADALEAYRDDLRAYLAENPHDVAASVLGSLDQHRARLAALDGDVPPEEAERLVTVARELARYLQSGDEAAVSTARERLRALRE